MLWDVDAGGGGRPCGKDCTDKFSFYAKTPLIKVITRNPC